MGRTTAIQATYKNENIQARFAINDGKSQQNTAWNTEDTEFAVTGRLDWLVDGTWGQFGDFTSWREEDFALKLGGAFHWQQSEYGTNSSGSEIFQWTLDGAAEFGGANLFASVFGMHTEPESGGADTDMYGFVIQGGVFVSDDVELFGRYEWGDDDVASTDDLSLLTFGFNKYFAKHNAKFTADIGFGINEIAGAWDKSSIGYREDASEEDGQLILRTQLQVGLLIDRTC